MITRLTRRINAGGETLTTSEIGPGAVSLPSLDTVNAALVLLAGIAAWLSYASVRAVAIGVFGPVGGSAFPLLLDCAVFVSSERYIRSALANMPMNGYRTLGHALIVGTIAANVSAAGDARAAYFHAIPPALFAALVELRGRQALREVRKAEGDTDRIPLRLWLVAPIESFALSLWAARAVSFAGLRAERERYLTARKALRIAVTGRKARVARRLVRRQLRTGNLDPAALVEASGLGGPVLGTGPDAVLRVALRAALGAPASAPKRTADTQSGPRAERTGKRTVKRAPSAPVVWDEGALQDAGRKVNSKVLAETGAPASARRLAAELRLGHARAGELRKWLEADYGLGGARIEHANGTELADAT